MGDWRSILGVVVVQDEERRGRSADVRRARLGPSVQLTPRDMFAHASTPELIDVIAVLDVAEMDVLVASYVHDQKEDWKGDLIAWR